MTDMVVKIPRKPKTKYKCTCGKQYDLNSTLKNHIKQKHNNDKSFQVNKGDRGRPPKQSPVFYQIKDGFVPEIQKLHQIAILILKSNQKFINNINLDNIKNQINSMNQEIDTQVSLIQMDEDAFYWYNQSKSFFDTHFKQLYESFNNSTLNQLLKACYSLSLLKFRNQKEKIIEQFIEKMKEI
ncbi:zinc finger, C2H2 type family protein (macronuclear) [Tetrahymena thermophila SB210]|uniref:Zinc finger, C2H2 type family protein n=1 Tax=Tetrahymena thermophila (strain SB210) TaxID=312017 RepID=I7M9Q7_TETTS|nr:zinc finger, C2H2 type family protein [Tetrahymena thermophila SB210]EAS02625.2 zinc finger, C2H2 type family protein [Tetrahymena thermophila SB210]|eukprot:XP_001022870.2 zinc finger, C2H2 type family protein [Tetrahymena thermophila SB210]